MLQASPRLPVLFIGLGSPTAHEGEPAQVFNTGVELASVSMRSVLWG